MSLPEQDLIHSAVVQPYKGAGAYGDVFGEPFDLPCYYEERRRLVRAADGTEAVSEGTIYANLGAEVPTDSRVSINNREVTVVSTSVFDDRRGLAHIEIDVA